MPVGLIALLIVGALTLIGVLVYVASAQPVEQPMPAGQDSLPDPALEDPLDPSLDLAPDPIVPPAPPTQPPPAPILKTLFSSYYNYPGRYVLGWAPQSDGVRQVVKVITNAIPGTSRYLVCQSNDEPRRHHVGKSCPPYWTETAQFYGYDAQAPGTIPLCLGHAADPLRGKIGIGEADCGLYGWTHDSLMFLPA